MRICLVSSLNLTHWYSRSQEPALLYLPLGLLSLAAVLENAGHKVSLVDLNYALCAGELSLDNDFYAAAQIRFEAESPQMLGFSTMCNSYHIALRLAENFKTNHPEIPVVFGGPQATMVDIQTLEAFPFVDLVVRGEAEQTLPRLIAELARGRSPDQVPGLTYRVNEHIVRNPDAPLLQDLDALPIPAYHLFPYGLKDSASIDAGRGCPFSCSFCSTSLFWRRRYRLKSIDRIIHEIQFLQKEYDATCFNFMHDSFTVNRRRLHVFCDRLQSEKIDITWSCSARVDCVPPPLLQHMAGVGCEAIFYGVETGSPRLQRTIRKNLKLEQVWSTIDLTLAAKMGTTVSFIAGFPSETKEDLALTMDVIQALLQREAVNVQLHLLAPQTGTPDYYSYRHLLSFDGYFSDIAAASQLLEPAWFEQYPELFSSFYYYRNNDLDRDFIRGLDRFIHGPCTAMPITVTNLLAPDRSLFSLYCDWKKWSAVHLVGGGNVDGQSVDDFILDFYEFASDRVAHGIAGFDLGGARDEILSFYLRHYGQIPVRYVPSA